MEKLKTKKKFLILRSLNNMLIIDSFGHNIYIGDQLVGYIKDNVLFVSNRKFADITDNGDIFFDGKEVGYVEEDGSIIIHDKEVGYINENNDFVFYKTFGGIK